VEAGLANKNMGFGGGVAQDQRGLKTELQNQKNGIRDLRTLRSEDIVTAL
jgi:hypothetical protein